MCILVDISAGRGGFLPKMFATEETGVHCSPYDGSTCPTPARPGTGRQDGVRQVQVSWSQHKFTNYQLRLTIPLMPDIEVQYNQALDYLYSFVDYSLKHISELANAEFNLDRMYALAEELGNPQQKYPIIHVAGTKG